MTWLPWRRLFRRHTNGHIAARAEADAREKLRRQADREVEFRRARESFTEAVERAMRGVR